MLTAVLRLSTMWEISTGRTWAIQHLSPTALRPPELLPAADRIKLSRDFCVPQWVEPAFRELYTADLLRFKDADTEKVGLKVFTTLVKVREAVARHRSRLAHYPPAVICGSSCSTDSRIGHERCVQAWQEAWWKKIGRLLLHPTSPCLLSDALTSIERMEVKGMHGSCLRSTVQSVKASDRFGYEEQAIRQAIDSIQQYQLSLVQM